MGFVSCCMRTNTTYVELRLNFFLSICVCIFFPFVQYEHTHAHTHTLCRRCMLVWGDFHCIYSNFCTRFQRKAYTSIHRMSKHARTQTQTHTIHSFIRMHVYIHRQTDRETPTLHTLTFKHWQQQKIHHSYATETMLTLLSLSLSVCMCRSESKPLCEYVCGCIFDLEFGTERNARIRITVKENFSLCQFETKKIQYDISFYCVVQ